MVFNFGGFRKLLMVMALMWSESESELFSGRMRKKKAS